MRTVEFVVTVLYIVLCVGIGIWANKRVSNSTDDYWVAGRKVGTFVNAWALMAALASGGSVLGVNALGFRMGIPYVFAMFAGAAAGFPLAAALVAKPLRNLRIRTVPEFFKLRYRSPWVDFLVPLIVVITMEVYVVAQLKAAGVTAVYLLGIDYNTAVIITSVVFILYVSIGGMWAITLTDVIQGVLMVFMVLLTALMVFSDFGGITPVLVQATTANPAYGAVRAMPISSYLGAFVVWFIAACVIPHLVMRVFSTRDARTARLSLNYAVLIYAFMIVFGVLAISSVGHVYFADLKDADMLFLKVIERYLPNRIVNGLAVSAVMAAVMSTTDALILAVTSAVVNDLYVRFVDPAAPANKVYRLSVAVTWIAGLLAVFFALNPPKLLTMLYTAAVGLIGSSLLPSVVLGIWWKRANAQGAFASILVGAFLYGYLVWFTKLPALSHILISLPVSFAVFYLVSSMTQEPPRDVVELVAKAHSQEIAG